TGGGCDRGRQPAGGIGRPVDGPEQGARHRRPADAALAVARQEHRRHRRRARPDLVGDLADGRGSRRRRASSRRPHERDEPGRDRRPRRGRRAGRRDRRRAVRAPPVADADRDPRRSGRSGVARCAGPGALRAALGQRPGDLLRDGLPDLRRRERPAPVGDRRAAAHPRPAGHRVVAWRAPFREPLGARAPADGRPRRGRWLGLVRRRAAGPHRHGPAARPIRRRNRGFRDAPPGPLAGGDRLDLRSARAAALPRAPGQDRGPVRGRGRRARHGQRRPTDVPRRVAGITTGHDGCRAGEGRDRGLERLRRPAPTWPAARAGRPAPRRVDRAARDDAHRRAPRDPRRIPALGRGDRVRRRRRGPGVARRRADAGTPLHGPTEARVGSPRRDDRNPRPRPDRRRRARDGRKARRVMRGEPRIEVLPDPEATSRAAATAIADALVEAVAQRGRALWATTGGSTPVGIYRELSVDPLRDIVPWSAVDVWWGDDRYVPRDHPLSNVLPLDQVLVSASARAGLSGTGEYAVDVETHVEPGVRLPVANIHAPRMGDAIGLAAGPEWAAEEYADRLRDAGLPTSDDGFPILDIVLVGVGPDGHVMSVFPGSALFDSEAWVSAVPAPTHVEPHVARISLHPRMLEVARLPIVVAHGAGKATALASVLGDERDVRRWPAQLARREGALWFLDRAAASELPSTMRG